MRRLTRPSDKMEQEAKRIIDRIEEVQEAKVQLHRDMLYAERVWRVAIEIGLIDEIENHIAEAPPYDDFFAVAAQLDEEERALMNRGEAISRNVTSGAITHRGWVCKSGAGRAKRAYDLKKIADRHVDLEINGAPLLRKDWVLDESVWKAAVKEGLLDEKEEIEAGSLTVTRGARSKHFKKKGGK